MAGRKDLTIEKKAESREKRGIITLFFCLCAGILFFISINVYTAQIKYDINTLNKEIQQSQRRIQNLEVEIKSATDINTLEARAYELGLIYPDYDDIIKINGENSVDEFAVALKEAVYK